MRRRRWQITLVTAGLLVTSLLTPPANAEPPDETYSIPGLRDQVDITVDTWGVPHISARNLDDLFRAQGFTAARDRLFQMDTWRRRGLGELSSVLGPEYAEQDAASRLFRYRGDMDAEWASYGPLGRQAATAFADGINAYVESLGENPEAMPEEFRTLGYEPARWAPEDVVVIRTHSIGHNLSKEVARAKLTCLGGPDAGRYFNELQPEHEPVIPDGLDVCSIPEDVTEVYDLATQDVAFDGTQMSQEDPRVKALREEAGGSNSWALAPERTATGRPILAGDPHRENYVLPSLRYISHLSAPGLDIVGAGEPWAPGISMGHNGKVAFGLTNMAADQADLYVYELHPEDPTRYRYRGRWERMRTVSEEIPVAGEAPRKVDLSYTRHGPVLRVDAENDKAYAVRTVWTQPGTSPYLGSLNLAQANDFAEFSAGMRDWRTPSSNLVYADRTGDIGWVAGALLPRRTGEGYDGLLPVPGDGRYEWRGFHSGAELPRERNPSPGWFASANEYNFPPGSKVVPGYEWTPEYRRERIGEVLAAKSDTSIADTVALQNDEVSGLARELVPHLRELSSPDPETTRALALLRDFDGDTSVGSRPAVLFETWLKQHLYPAWAHTMLPQQAADHLVASSLDADFRPLQASLGDPENWFPDGSAGSEELLLTSLRAAYADVAAQLGPDESTWNWGALHFHQFAHPLGGPNVGPVAKGGSFHTVRASNYLNVSGPNIEVVGATYRMAIDVGAWDNSRAINGPGQSGDQRDPHYDDLAPAWTEGGSFPLLYTGEAIEQNAERRILLRP